MFKRNFKNSKLLVMILGLILCLFIIHPDVTKAEVTKFEVISKETFGRFKTGVYIKITGKVTGELRISEPITDLFKADQDKNGLVEYSTDFILIVPEDLSKSNGALIFDVENRGNPIAHNLYNSPRDFPVGQTDLGIGFLEDQGFMLAIASWELGHGISLPTFVDDQGDTCYIEGVGFPAVRDFVMFLKHAAEDGAGNPNPLAGFVTRTIGVGYSQTGRFLKTMVVHGFNWMHERRVFDGMHVQAGHAGLLPILQSGTGPASSGARFPTFANPDYPGVHEPPFTYQDIMQTVVDRGEMPPQIVVTNMTNDYYSLRASLCRTGVAGINDVPVPANVRMYDVAGGPHAIIPLPGCDHPRGRLDWHPVMRAVLLHLDRWVHEGVPPPDNRLMPLEASSGDSLVLDPPAVYPSAIIQVPKMDEDGNALGGVRLPDIQVPLGTHGGQNTPLTDVGCTLSGSFVPFARTKEERITANDERLSIEERYTDKNDYVNRIAQAAWSLVDEGFMLEQDAIIVIHAAAQSPVFRKSIPE